MHIMSKTIAGSLQDKKIAVNMRNDKKKKVFTQDFRQYTARKPVCLRSDDQGGGTYKIPMGMEAFVSSKTPNAE